MSSFSPAKLGLSWASEPALSPSAATGTPGEQETRLGGGSSAGLPLGNRVGILSVTRMELGVGFCGGMVGGGGRKMCVRANCTIGAHQAQKGKVDVDRVFLKETEDISWSVDEVCFIVATSDSAGTPTVVHVDPSLPRMFLPSAEASEYLQRKQTTESWKMIFESLKAVHSEDVEGAKADEDGEVVIEKILRAETKEGYYVTPKKRRGRGLEESPSEDFVIPIRELPEVSDLQPDQQALRLILESWDSVRYNFDFLASVTANTKERTRERANDLEDMLDELDIKVVSLRSLLGNRSQVPELGTDSICRGLDDLFSTVSTIEGQVAGLDAWKERSRAELLTSLGTMVEASIARQVFSGDYHEKWIMPLCRLLQSVSSSFQLPGDRLFSRLEAVEAKLQSLEARHATPGAGAPPAPTPFPLWPTGPTGAAGVTPPGPLPAPAPAGVMSILTDQVALLQAEVEQLKAQQEAESVQVGGVRFKSLADTAAWMARTGAERYIYLFVDPMSLLSMSDVVKIDESESAKSRANAARIADPNPEYTQYVASFSLEVPPIFGRSSDPNTTSSSKALAAIPNFAAWDTGMGVDGVKDRLADLILDGQSQIMNEIGLNLPAEAGLVAKEMAIDAMRFWVENSSFMTTFTTECCNRSEASQNECWQLTSHCERAIFKLLRNARKVGQRRVPAQMLWGTLQANRVAKELLAYKFQGHPNVSIILHQHLIDHSVPTSKFNSLHAEVTALRKDLTAVKQTADKGLSTANNVMKKK